MTPRKILTALIVLGLPMAARAQSHTSGAKSSYDEFRQSLLSGYQEYRQNILDDYDSFLEGIWADYEANAPIKRDSKPKPARIPTVPVATPPAAHAPATPATPAAKAPEATTKPAAPVAEAPSTPAQPAKPAAGQADKPSRTSAPSAPSQRARDFMFYSMSVGVPAMATPADLNPSTPADYGAAWRELKKTRLVSDVIPALQRAAKDHNLNDYFEYELVREYVDNVHGSLSTAMRAAMKHFILANMHYDVRLAVANGVDPMLLLTFDQQVFARPYLTLDGRSYYVFPDDDAKLEALANATIRTCSIPADMDKGEKMDLRVSEMKIPYSPLAYEFAFDGVAVKGEVNGNLKPMLKHYPQMPIGDFAASMVSPEVRAEIVSQVKAQIGDKPDLDTVNRLLHLVQYGFQYATDEKQHGYEKPYFFEEMLFYPQCDCEDRAIFYSYLLKNVLGVENHIIQYPGHESLALHIDDPEVSGDGYEHEGKQFYISDPTYMGANTGLCMPTYARRTPRIDFVCK